jgi:hypothetical protein
VSKPIKWFDVPSAFLEKVADPLQKPKGPAGWTTAEGQERGARRAEIPEQKTFGQWLDLKDILWINPRSDKKSTIRAGCSDFMVFHRSKTLFLEMKAPKCKQSQHQLGFEQSVIKAGHVYRLAFSSLEAIEICREFFGL